MDAINLQTQISPDLLTEFLSIVNSHRRGGKFKENRRRAAEKSGVEGAFLCPTFVGVSERGGKREICRRRRERRLLGGKRLPYMTSALRGG